MRLGMEGVATVRGRPKAALSTLFSAFLTISTSALPEYANAQNENPDVQATGEMQVCKAAIDKEIASGRMTADWEHLAMGLCAVVFFQCKTEVAGILGDSSAPDLNARVLRCVSKRLEDASNYSGGTSSQDQSETTPPRSSRCSLLNAVIKSAIAQKACSRAIAAGIPDSHERALAYAHLAYAEFSLDPKDRSGRAVSDGTAAIQLDPRLGEAYASRGFVHANKTQFEAAVADFDKALALDLPDWLRKNVYFARGYGRAVIAAQDRNRALYEDALADFAEAIKLDPDSANSAQYYRARAAFEDQWGDTAAAQSDRETVARLQGQKP